MNRSSQLILNLVAGIAMLWLPPVFAIDPPQPSAIINTSHGKVQGLVENGVAAYKGIRYGAPPTGERRFMPPLAPAAWEGVEDATGYGAPAMQWYSRAGAATDLSRQISTIYTTATDQKIDNEDCLFLNLWAPLTATEKRPVMVWFHGGGFAYGSGHWPVYDGASLAAKGDVIVITVNHRLNVFGFLDLSELDPVRFAESGNLGMLDLVLVLQWVRDNAAAFGGDPDNITIMGESGGGAKVSTLMAMPAAAGLFHKAIVQSGPGLTGIPQATARENTRKILAKLGISGENLAQLTSLTADQIMAATIAAAADAGPDFMSLRLGPVVDGKVLPRDPFIPAAPAQARDIPLMIGWNKDEFSLFNAGAPWFGRLTEEQLLPRSQAIVGEKAGALLDAYRELYPDYSPTYLFNMLIGDVRMFQGSVMLADRKVAQQGAPVYMYYLVWETPVGGGVFKSPHTLDMPFMFNNVDKSVAITGDSPAARQLENQMSSAWIAFAHSGNPGNNQLPHWPAYNAVERSTMVFDVEPRVENDPKSKIRQLLIGQTE